MPQIKLTDRTLRTLKTRPGEIQTDWWDRDFPGGSFGVRVGKESKVFNLIYRRPRDRRKQRISFKPQYPQLSLKEAREKAHRILADVRDGKDPAQERREYDAAETFEQLCDQFFKRHVLQKKSGTQREYKRIIDNYLLPVWGPWKAQDIRKKDAVALIDSIADRAPIMANRVRALISKIFNFAMRKDLAQFNPVHQTDRPAAESRKTRTLAGDEIKVFWEKCDSLEEPLGQLFKLILLTGQRPGEVKSMRWKDIEDDRWIISAEVAKNGLRHVVPLSSQALDILAKLKALAERHERKTAHPGLLAAIPVYVFYSDTGRFIEWLAKAVDRLNALCRFNERFTAHDLRRSCATGMASIGVSREVIGAVLNHKTLDNAITAHYDLFDQIEEKSIALTRWGKRIESLVTGSTGTVISLRRRANG